MQQIKYFNDTTFFFCFSLLHKRVLIMVFFVLIYCHNYHDTADRVGESSLCRTPSLMQFPFVKPMNLFWFPQMLQQVDTQSARSCKLPTSVTNAAVGESLKRYRYSMSMLLLFFHSILWEKQEQPTSCDSNTESAEKVKLARLLGRCTRTERAGKL